MHPIPPFRRQIYVAFSNSQWDFQETDKYCSAPSHMSISPTEGGLGHLENSTRSIPPTEIWTPMLSTLIKLLQVHFGQEVWGVSLWKVIPAIYQVYTFGFHMNRPGPDAGLTARLSRMPDHTHVQMTHTCADQHSLHRL